MWYSHTVQFEKLFCTYLPSVLWKLLHIVIIFELSIQNTF
jgi:hypothetical protein